MRDIEYQPIKGDTPVIHPKTVFPGEYHEFLDVFLESGLGYLGTPFEI